MKVVITEKTEAGALIPVDARDWNEMMVNMLNHSNYLLVNGKEYEMVEGRLNVNEQVMELLVLAVKNEAENGTAAEQPSAEA
jgi:hypothetical protein